MNCKGCKHCHKIDKDEWIMYPYHFCDIDLDGGSISESQRWCKGKYRVEKVEQKAQNNMARERKKPEGSFIERAKNEIDIDKACDEFCNRCPAYADDLDGLQGCGKRGCDVLRDFRKAVEE